MTGNQGKGKHRERRAKPPLTPESLRGLALRYVERFATSRARLERYLATKLRERGWHEAEGPDLQALSARFVELGYVLDEAFANARAGSMARRGLGARRVRAQLAADGIEEATASGALAGVRSGEAALTLARRKRLGPFGPGAANPKERQRQMGVLLRAGHDLALTGQLLRATTIEEAQDVAVAWDDEQA